MIHSSHFEPRAYAFKGSMASIEIDRAQELRGTLALNREKIKEIGRVGLVDWRKRIPTLGLTLSQLEYGSMEFWQMLANTSAADTTITEADFKETMIDIAGYKTDDNAAFLGTVWYPDLRLQSFSLNIGDPEAYIMRSFNFVGEDEIILQNANKYLIVREMTAVGAASNEAFIISDGGSTYPNPVMDPDNSGQYLLKVVHYDLSATTSTELEVTTDYTFNGTTTATILRATGTGDTLKFYWSAGTYITGGDIFTNNDGTSSISADSCDIWLETSQQVYKLQSLGINVGLTRSDYKEIGNSKIIQRGVKETVSTITLGRILEAYTIEEILRDKTGLSYGLINPRNFADDIALKIKLYTDNTKDTFAMQYSFTNLSPTNLDAGVPLDDYVTAGNSLESDNFTVTNIA